MEDEQGEAFLKGTLQVIYIFNIYQLQSIFTEGERIYNLSK